MIIFNDSPTTKTNDGRYRKQILKYGSYVDKYDPDEKMIINKELGEELIKNKKRYPDIPFSDGHPSLFGSDKATDNLGWVQTIELEDDGVYAEIDVLSAKAKEGIEDGTIKHVSVGMFRNYLDNETGNRVGARLEHLAAVPSPYLKGMKKFDKLSEDSENRVYVFNENKTFDKVEGEEYTEDMNTVNEPTKLSKEEQLDNKIEMQEAQDLKYRAKVAYSELLEASKISPAQKEAFLNFADTEDRLEAAKALLNVNEFRNMPNLNEEKGTEEVPETKKEEEELDEEALKQLGVSKEDVKEFGEDK